MDLRRLDHILSKATLSSELNDWETNFIEDLTKRRARLGNSITISESQEAKLEQIAEKAV